MKSQIITGIGLLTLGGLTFAMSNYTSADQIQIQRSSGYISIVLGLVTLGIGLFESRQKKAMALLISGAILVLLGEKLPSLLFRAIFGIDKEADLRETGLIYLFLGVTCVVASWIFLVLDGKSENKK